MALPFLDSLQGAAQYLQPGLQNVGNYAQTGFQGLGAGAAHGLRGLGAGAQAGAQALGTAGEYGLQGLNTAGQYGLQGAQAGLRGLGTATQAGLRGTGYGLQGLGAGLSGLGNYGSSPTADQLAQLQQQQQPNYPSAQNIGTQTDQQLSGQFQQPMQQSFPNQVPQQMGQMGFQPQGNFQDQFPNQFIPQNDQQGNFPQSQNEQFKEVVEPEIDPKTGKKTGRFKTFMRKVGRGLKEVGKGAKEFALGKEGKLGTYDLFNPTQQAAFSQILQHALGNLGSQNQFSFDPIAKEAREQFSQQTVPSIAERFSGMGAQRSSAFPQILGQAGANLESSLASQKAQVGLQNQQQQQRMLAALLELGLQPQFSSYYQQPSQGLLQSAASGLPLLGYAALSGRDKK